MNLVDELIQSDSSSVFYNSTLSFLSTMLGRIWESKRKLVLQLRKKEAKLEEQLKRSLTNWIRGERENDLFDKKKVLSLTETHSHEPSKIHAWHHPLSFSESDDE